MGYNSSVFLMWKRSLSHAQYVAVEEVDHGEEVNHVQARTYRLLQRRGHATPIVTVQTSKFFSVATYSDIALVHTHYHL